MKKIETVKKAEILERQYKQQQLNEMYLSRKLYGVQEPKITKTRTKGRKVTINAHALIESIVNIEGVTPLKVDYCNVQLSKDETLALDLVTREALYFNDRTGEESYLDNITFTEG